MPNKFEIAQVISRGKGTAQITVNFEGRSVTRHLQGNVGRHPDDSIPGRHKSLESNKVELEGILQDRKRQLADVTDPKNPRKLTKLQAGAMLDRLSVEIPRLTQELADITTTLDNLRREDPIMVTFV